jgi:hypothetical protein
VVVDSTTRLGASVSVVTLNYRLLIVGLLPQSALDLLSSRFGVDACSVEQSSTVLTGTVSDQPQLRALLTLIWDVGGRVDSLETTPQTALDHRATTESSPRPGGCLRPISEAPSCADQLLGRAQKEGEQS